MPDSTDQISQAYEHWGGNADGTFGVSPQELAEKYKQNRLPFMPPCKVAPLNPYLHQDLWYLTQEIAASLNAIQPRLYQIVDYDKHLIMPIGYYPPDRIFLDLDLCQWLSRQELRGILAHEMRHSQQSTINMLVRRNIGQLSHAIAQAADGVIGSVAGKIAEYCIQQAGIMESDADSAGASLVGKEVMQCAILKLALFVITKSRPGVMVDITDLDCETASRKLDEILQTNPSFTSRLCAGTTITTRIQRLDDKLAHQFQTEENRFETRSAFKRV